MSSTTGRVYDAVIVGSGPSGSWIAKTLAEEGMECLLLEAGPFVSRDRMHGRRVEANAQLFWHGGLELNERSTIGLLRPRCVGGGSVVNQALMDRFPAEPLNRWRRRSGVGFFDRETLDPWYQGVEDRLSLKAVPEAHRNHNPRLFAEGLRGQGKGVHDLRRAQADCRYEDGNDCVVCLNGCPIDSKESMMVTVLKDALEAGLRLEWEFEVRRLRPGPDTVEVVGEDQSGETRSVRAKRVVLAAGALGNARLLLESGMEDSLPAVGSSFFCHPQTMVFGLYAEPVDAFRGGFQAVAADDEAFREEGFKLENVFGFPADLAMLFPGFGRDHLRKMKQIRHVACSEVAVRDRVPGELSVDGGTVRIQKSVTGEDRKRRRRGVRTLEQMFRDTGARETIVGSPNIAVHLMGGCTIGTDPSESVVSPEFHLHGYQNIYAADSSIFPAAPGVNPALTIMALSRMAARSIVEGAG